MADNRRVEARDLIAQLVCQGFIRVGSPRRKVDDEGNTVWLEWWHLRTSDGPITVKLVHPLKVEEVVDGREEVDQGGDRNI